MKLPCECQVVFFFFFLQEYVNKLKPVLSKEAKVKLSKKMYKKKKKLAAELEDVGAKAT